MKPATFWMGLALMLAYILWVKPPGAPQGYTEDSCLYDITRQLQAEAIHDTGGPSFVTTHAMAPEGASIPFMPWGLERDWLGAYAWLWDRTFPFLWVYFGATLLASYFVLGYLLTRMRIPPPQAWGLATLFVLVNIPRHFKTWFHYEHLTIHWIYASIFLDAWIWQRFYAENKWRLKDELWRAVTMLGTLGIAGYFWGPMIIEWTVVRVSLLTLARMRKRRASTLDWRLNKSAVPLVILGVQTLILARWFLPLYSEFRKAGSVWQAPFFFGDFVSIIRPLWLEGVNAALGFFGKQYMLSLRPLDWAETVLTVGWLYWVPALTAMWLSRKKFGLLAPFVIFLLVAVMYVQHYGRYFPFQAVIQAVVPFMSYFRVPSRWGLLFTPILGAIIALGWPVLSERARRWRKRSTLVLVMGAFECLWLFYPVKYQPRMPQVTERMLERIHDLPGSTVLDFPFCVAGGNAVCTKQMCPNYPASTTGICLREWHEKNVYGLYQGRTLESHCQIYSKKPFLDWFDAWTKQRCLTKPELDALCGYLGAHSELSAFLVYPDIWTAARDPVCRGTLEKRLGQPLDEAWVFTGQNRGGRGSAPTRILWYPSRCGKS